MHNAIVRNWKTSDFDYTLPPDLIAQTPIEPRDAARLLVIHRESGTIEHRVFQDLVNYLRPGDVLIANDSRVLPARLYGRKSPSGGRVELLLLAPRDAFTWEVLIGGRRVRAGTRIEIVQPTPVPTPPNSPLQGGVDDPPLSPLQGGVDDPPLSPLQGGTANPPLLVGGAGGVLTAEVLVLLSSGARLVRFNRPVEEWLGQTGEIPLPPYIHTPLSDPERYQTVYSRIAGSAAAPTAGLHFTAPLIERIQAMGVGFACVTLHVGLDTFRPVEVEDIRQHAMHSEWATLPAETAEAINRTRAGGGRVIAVGTTAVRVLESAALAGEGIDVSQQQDLAEQKRLGQPLNYRPNRNRLAPFTGRTRLFITPGYQFRVVDTLLTNFHLPRSTLLMLVTAFAGEELVRRAYQAAIEQRYRFYSFGDATLWI